MVFRVVIALAFAWTSVLFAQDRSTEVSATSIRSTFFLHVVNYSRWPSEVTELTFCVLEQAPHRYFTKLNESGLVTKSKQKLQLLQLDSYEQAIERQCDYLFVDKLSESTILDKDLKQISLSIVTIGESAAFINNGGLMSLIEEYKKIRIYINKELYEVSPIKFSARLLKYANFTG